MKQLEAPWLSIPYPNGPQYSQIFPFCPPVVVYSAAGYLVDYRGAGGRGADDEVNGACVSLSCAKATTSDHVKVDPCSVTLVVLTCSNAACRV